MSSYVAVQGTPRKDNCFVFGLTPKEVRYLRVRIIIETDREGSINANRIHQHFFMENRLQKSLKRKKTFVPVCLFPL